MFKAGFADNFAVQMRRTLAHLAVWGLFITFGALVSGKVFIIPGLLTGWLGSVIYFLLMCRRVKKSAELPHAQAIASMRAGWLIRFSFAISMLVLSVHVPWIDFWAAVVGLFSLHIVLMVNAVITVISGLIANVGKSNLKSGRE
ncbi:ATP synthase subunit I [Sporomusa sp.]|uniref:ATP synthase subunit I n=1 Tax=Sporomusa sp. TaxID=2078658 RepID=UPI002C0DAE25|nr:ATP synthase subunit I [Sporomusa sp.]HWR44372.1 ATP synthase subunit I [Sporomusa sp.]